MTTTQNADILKREGGEYGDVVLLRTIAEHLLAVAKEVEA